MSFEFTNKDKAMLKETLWKSAPAILLVVFFWFLTIYIEDTIVLMGVLVGAVLILNIVLYLMKKIVGKTIFTNILWLVLFLTIANLLGELLGGKGLLGFLLLVFIFSAYILLKRRKLYMSWIHHIETKLYGEPLRRKKK